MKRILLALFVFCSVAFAAQAVIIYTPQTSGIATGQPIQDFHLLNNFNSIASSINSINADISSILTSITSLKITGEVRDYPFSTPPAGWVVLSGTTIGSAASGATGRASADTQNLFCLYWNDAAYSSVQLQDSTGANTTRGASCSADFAANKRLPLPDRRGRNVLGSGGGPGLANRPLNSKGGEENHTLSISEMPTHSHSVNDPGHFHASSASNAPGTQLLGPGVNGASVNGVQTGTATTGITLNNNGGGVAHNVMDPYVTTTWIQAL